MEMGIQVFNHCSEYSSKINLAEETQHQLQKNDEISVQCLL